MAHMYPEELNENFSAAHEYAGGEKRVYEKLRDELDDDWYVFHDLAWDDPRVADDQRVGQADFVIANPQIGFLVLEVKGGRCSYHAADRVWETEDRRGKHAGIKDPFEQSATGARVIHKLMVRGRSWGKLRVPWGQSAVVFPDCTMSKRQLRGDIPVWKILDQEDLFNFGHTIRKLFDSAFPDSKLKKADGLKIIDFLKKLWGVHDADSRRRLDLRLRHSYEKLVALTENQRKVLRSLAEQKRVRVSGCAGSGKTTLAVHKAKMLAEEGKRVGFFCFNIPLAEHLVRECAGHEAITVGGVAELFQDWLREAGVQIKDGNTNEWWAETLPNLVFDNLDRIPHRFDAVVVDEGQDIKENYWPVIELMLSNPDEAVFYVFADKGQNIYHGKMNLSFEPSPYTLNQNVRNTNEVFKVVRQCCEIADDIEPSGVSGVRPELYYYRDDDEMLATIKSINERLITEAMTPNDIVILGTKSQERSALKQGEKIGPFPLVETPETSKDIVTMTMNRFKGLEAPVVILCELDDELSEREKRAIDVLYIGLTRSTGMVIGLATGKLYERLKGAGFEVVKEP